MRIRKREARGAVVKYAVRPNGNAVAGRAGGRGGRKVRRYVVRHVAARRLRAQPRRLVAAHAIRRGQIVVVIYVARHAGRGIRRHVCAHERKTSYGVIETVICPGDGVVARGTIGHGKRTSGRRMRRIVRGLPGAQVAARIPAVRGLNIQRIIVVDVALRARGYFPRGRHLVGIGERETGSAVIESCVRPRRGVVASGTLRHRKAPADVIWHVATQSLRAVPVLQVAAGVSAIRGRNLQRVVVVDMALRAGRGHMHAGQRETSHAVVERCQVRPGDRVVTL